MGLHTLKNLLGFTFNGIGLSWAVFDKSLCGAVCGNVCTGATGSECSFLFLFLAIILIVCGYAIIKMQPRKNKLRKFLGIK